MLHHMRVVQGLDYVADVAQRHSLSLANKLGVLHHLYLVHSLELALDLNLSGHWLLVRSRYELRETHGWSML